MKAFKRTRSEAQLRIPILHWIPHQQKTLIKHGLSNQVLWSRWWSLRGAPRYNSRPTAVCFDNRFTIKIKWSCENMNPPGNMWSNVALTWAHYKPRQTAILTLSCPLMSCRTISVFCMYPPFRWEGIDFFLWVHKSPRSTWSSAVWMHVG